MPPSEGQLCVTHARVLHHVLTSGSEHTSAGGTQKGFSALVLILGAFVLNIKINTIHLHQCRQIDCEQLHSSIH